MKEGWKVKTLDELTIELFAGGDVPKDCHSKFITKNYNIPIYSNGAKGDGLYGYTDKARVKVPSITVSARGTIGYSSVRIEPYLPVVRLIVLVPNQEVIILHYLKYVIESLDFGNSGTSIPQLTVPMIKKYECQIPLLEEQKQIVAILDQAFEAIDQAKANIQKNIENAKELFDSTKEEIFKKLSLECKLMPIIDTCKKMFAGGDKPKLNFSKYETDQFKVPVISNGEKNEGFFGYTNEARVTEPSITISARGTIGFTVFRDYAFVPIVRLIVLIPNLNIVNPEFLMHAIKSLDIIKSGSSIPQLTAPMMKVYSIPVPTKVKQDEIVEQLNELQMQLSQYDICLDQKLNNLEELKKSILQKAFNGELTHKEEFLKYEQVAEASAIYEKI